MLRHAGLAASSTIRRVALRDEGRHVGHAALMAVGCIDFLGRHLTGRVEDHFHNRHEEDGCEGNGTRHGWVVLGPEAGQARVAEGDEGRREEMHKRGGDEDAGAKVADHEEKACRDAEAGELGGENRKRAAGKGDEEDDEEGADVEGHVVFILVGDATRSTG